MKRLHFKRKVVPVLTDEESTKIKEFNSTSYSNYTSTQMLLTAIPVPIPRIMTLPAL